MMSNDVDTNRPAKSDNDAMNKALSGFLESVGCPEGDNPEATSILVAQVQHLRVLAGKVEGSKAEARRALTQTFGLKGNTSYADVISYLDDDTEGVLRTDNPIPFSEWEWMHNLLEVDEVVEDDDDNDEVVEDETPMVSTESMITSFEATMKRLIKSLRDSVNARFDSIESVIEEMDDSIVSMESKMASRPARSPSLMDSATNSTKVETKVEPVVEDDDEPTPSDGDFTVKKLYTPKGWTDGDNYVVGVICDSVTAKKNGNTYGVRLAHGMNKVPAIESARKIALRSILKANGWNIQGDDWFVKAAEKGVTLSVIDSFLTGAVKNRQTCGRSAATMLKNMGITDLASYKDAATIGGTDASTPSDDGEVATVDLSEVKRVMDTYGVSESDAIEFLNQ